MNETILSLLLKIWTMAWELWCLLETCQKGRISDLTQIHCSLQSSSEKQNQRKEREAGGKRFIIRNWLTRLWRLTSPKIHRVTWQAGDTGGPMVQLEFKADGVEIQEELMNQFEPKGRKTHLSNFKSNQTGGIFTSLGKSQPFCSTQAFN